jgi:hypothetical protein
MPHQLGALGVEFASSSSSFDRAPSRMEPDRSASPVFASAEDVDQLTGAPVRVAIHAA